MANRYTPEMIEDIWQETDEALTHVSNDMADALIARMQAINSNVDSLSPNEFNKLRTRLVNNYRHLFATAGT